MVGDEIGTWDSSSDSGSHSDRVKRGFLSEIPSSCGCALVLVIIVEHFDVVIKGGNAYGRFISIVCKGALKGQVCFTLGVLTNSE
jgi:hypothetical protein